MTVPDHPLVVFVSYAHDNDEHRAAVRRFAELLARTGIDVRFDQLAGPVAEWSTWAEREMRTADFVLAIASPDYRRRADKQEQDVGGTGRGVIWEVGFLRDLIYEDRQTQRLRILPVVLPGRSAEEIPSFLAPAGGHQIVVPSLTPAGVRGVREALLSRSGPTRFPHSPAPDSRRPEGQPHRRRRRVAALGAAVLALALLATYLVGRDWRRPVPSADGCSLEIGPAAVVQPDPATGPGRRFCPVRINGGQLPITGDFSLEGQVLAPLQQRQHLLLAVTPARRSCDANGKHPSGRPYVIDQVDLASSDGRWSYTDDLGGDKAGVTLIRDYEYLTGTAAALTILAQDRLHWIEDHGGGGKYPGILRMPPGAEVLARFQVPGNSSAGRRPCDVN